MVCVISSDRLKMDLTDKKPNAAPATFLSVETRPRPETSVFDISLPTLFTDSDNFFPELLAPEKDSFRVLVDAAI